MALALLAVVSFTAVSLVPIEKSPPAPPPPPLNASLDKRINTGGDNGAYQTQFCPRLLAAVAKVLFRGYWCATSRGTVENIDRVLEFPANIGLAQLDILADEAVRRAAELKKLIVIRTDACEGLWMVTRNPGLKTYENVRENASRIRFVLPKDSGSAASFAFLQANDFDRLGRVSDAKKHYMADTTAVLNEVARSNDEAVGFFVQFADPDNANFKLITQTELTIVPVISNEILDILQWDGQPVYQQRTFETKSGGVPGMLNLFTRKVTTACTPLTIITGKPEALGSGEDKSTRGTSSKRSARCLRIYSHNRAAPWRLSSISRNWQCGRWRKRAHWWSAYARRSGNSRKLREIAGGAGCSAARPQ
jgi:hypothetical protein